MILVLKNGTPKSKVEEICNWLTASFGVQTSPIFGSGTTIIGLVGDTSEIEIEAVEAEEAVERVMKVQEPYKRANRKFHPDDTIIRIGDIVIGGNRICCIAGPCSVESEDQITFVAERVRAAGAQLLRGGAFKPRTSPYAFQGLKAEGLMFMKRARQATGLPIVSEITNPSQLDLFMEFVDIIQVGARNMQNFELLKELGRVRKPVLIKRGFANTVDELLMSAEYIMSGGNSDVILCERGIRTFETSTRNTLDISAIPVLKSRTHLPVFVDPSHAAGHAWLVEPLAKAAVAAGADGLVIEVHNDPKRALSDGQQSLTPDAFAELMNKLRPVAAAIGREI
jgi:3-deoxy-7-phosphoheptulonate synthase